MIFFSPVFLFFRQQIKQLAGHGGEVEIGGGGFVWVNGEESKVKGWAGDVRRVERAALHPLRLMMFVACRMRV